MKVKFQMELDEKYIYMYLEKILDNLEDIINYAKHPRNTYEENCILTHVWEMTELAKEDVEYLYDELRYKTIKPLIKK